MAGPRLPTQSDRPARVYPLKWMEGTFSSRKKTESLLRPEFENGNVAYHDMELAQSFFSSKNRYLPLLYSNLAFLGTVVYSRRFARPKWSMTKLVTISTFLGCGSYSFGFDQKLAAHVRFARTLENPAGFNRALRNINARLGGREPFPYGVPEQQEERLAVFLGPGAAALPKDPNVGGSPIETTEPVDGWTVSPSQEEPDQSQTQQTIQPSVQRPPGKWDEIRAANNKAGSASSWDLIRQSHERNKMSPPPSSQSSTHSHNPVGGTGGTYSRDNSTGPGSSVPVDKDEEQWDSRASDEAQFEAVLEAERRRASRA